MKKLNVNFHPLIPEHRIRALLAEYNSETDECPFYTEEGRHSCLLDYNSVHVYDCGGHCFQDGFCCEFINSLFFEEKAGP